MDILIVGLGLIGASYAEGLKKSGHTIYGVDVSEDTLNYALEHKMVDFASKNPLDFISKAKLIIIGLYPKLILDFVKTYNPYFNKNQIITDVCGIKTEYVYDAIKLTTNATYIAHHPMAGREKVGITFATSEIFKKANFLICNVNNKEEDINILKSVAKDLGFARISVISPEKHDKMIGFTSQLTHAIAVSLVNSDTEADTKLFIGDSYRDLTRIAMINEELWSELFLSNKKYLLDEIKNFEEELDKLKLALKNEDSEALKQIFRNSKKKRSEMEK